MSNLLMFLRYAEECGYETLEKAFATLDGSDSTLIQEELDKYPELCPITPVDAAIELLEEFYYDNSL